MQGFCHVKKENIAELAADILYIIISKKEGWDMRIQKTDWGQIEWLHNAEKGNALQSMEVGISTVLPGKQIKPHIHYGHEQMLYILSGQGYYYINGERQEYKQGMHFYIPADSTHETIPTGDEPTNELTISNPVFSNVEITDVQQDDVSVLSENILYTAVEAIQEQLLQQIAAPFTIFDNTWNMISQGGIFPVFCDEKCHANQDRANCQCMKIREVSDFSFLKNMQFRCPYGLTVVQLGIVYNDSVLGVIRGGHMLLSEQDMKEQENLSVTPASTFYSIQRKLTQIVNSIIKFCNFHEARKELLEKDEQIRIAETDSAALRQNLSAAQDNVTNLKINHHFLFNTLNSMASMALTGRKMDLYTSIISLSKMFRYTMATDLKFVPFSEEVEYLQTYLNLQRLRYGDSLSVDIDIPKDLMDIQVPFNFLQPIVENAFTHGFAVEMEQKKVMVHAGRSGDTVLIHMFNNGRHLDEVTLRRVEKSLENNSGHGLSLIYAKLKSAYQDTFTMEFESQEGIGVTVLVTIPVKE